MTSRLRTAVPWLLGTPGDWHLRRPPRPRLRPNAAWIGPALVLGSVLVGWFAFADAVGQKAMAPVGLWVGSVAILLMAWSFILALRIRLVEGLFGGLDGMYRAHRWAGALGMVAMFLHTRIEPELESGVLGASKSVARFAQDLAGVGEIMLYVLVGVSLVRLVPYRWWRWSHKLIGVPFVFGSWHFFTALKPYANGSSWGWWFGSWMVAGTLAWLWRIGVRDGGVGAAAHRYRVVAADHDQRFSVLRLAPADGDGELGHRVGQFAFLRLAQPGLTEPHPFTIASSPRRSELTVVVGHLGDWSRRLPQADLVGSNVRVEGPYGHFRPFPADRARPTLWIAGGVGLTPFLAAIDDDEAAASEAGGEETTNSVPTLLYATRHIDTDPLVEQLRWAEASGRIRLHVFGSGSARLSAADLDRLFPGGLVNHHVALCGPDGLVRDLGAAAGERGAVDVVTEDFDIRQGFGPERSTDWEELIGRWLPLLRPGGDGPSASAGSPGDLADTEATLVDR